MAGRSPRKSCIQQHNRIEAPSPVALPAESYDRNIDLVRAATMHTCAVGTILAGNQAVYLHG
jgi:hypothetical protein